MKLNDINYIKTEDQIINIGKALKKKVVALGISKKELAEKADVSLNTINNCIAGRNSNLKSLINVLQVMGVNIVDFMKEVTPEDISPLEVAPEETEAMDPEVIEKEIEETGQTAEQLASRTGVSIDRMQVISGA
jgi:transcriptional regulator with XRE-family HTH domain